MEIVYLLLILLFSFVASFVAFPLMIPRLRRSGISGKDMNKPGQPEVAEMGGLGIVLGFGAGTILIIALKTFTDVLSTVNLQSVLAVFSTVLIAAMIGVFDDLIDIKQWVKAVAPLFSALPLMAVQAGDSTMSIPLIGPVGFGLIYTLVLVPVGLTAAANATNMLAGFNGLEAGMGIIGMAALALIAFHLEETTALVILLAAIGALLAFLRYNWYPARIFIGDIGALLIGAIIASAVIIGNFEIAGVIIIIPYAIEFLIKARNHFPSKEWWGRYQDGKLHCPESRPMGLGQLVMKLTGGIREQNLTLVLMGSEAVCGAIAVAMYW
jgi:UDP-N-acetylglucosamine--dolichyl-phosphate N-acetylglucosaminephosphotransferase